MPVRKPPSPISPHTSCSICSDIPDRCRSFDKGGETLENTIPPAVYRLEIVGAPFYDQSTSHSNWCLLRCSECGTYFDWDFEYEYLVNGSEDDLNITRLSPEEGQRKAALVAAHVDGSRRRFAAESPPHLETLAHGMDPEAVRKAASWVFMAGEAGNDLTGALPLLVAAWLRPEVQGDAASSIHLALFVHGSRSRLKLASLRAAIEAAGAESRPELATLLRSCENIHVAAETGKPLGSA